ncbi:MAG: DNA-binding protein [Deltaproteobacteria bacterium]|jgi:predicted DNA-binding protein with PD1-like motif|nr:DNA-binding protein [Deltaproteobacteria bacterium]
MQSTELKQPQWHKLHFGPGEDIFQGLREFFQEKKFKQAFILSSIGSLEKITCNYPVVSTRMPPDIKGRTVEDFLEINGINGEIWREEGRIRVHLHGSFTHEVDKLYGGGIADGSARALVLVDMVVMGIPE